MFHRHSPPVGSRPGTLIINEASPKPKIFVCAYTRDTVNEWEQPTLDELPGIVEQHTVTWIDVQGLGDEDVLKRIADLFKLHELAVEDVVNIPQRPKTEPYENHLFGVMRVAALDENHRVSAKQISLFLGPKYVITFQEEHGDFFGPIQRRIHAGLGPIRQQGADYLAYAFLDIVIDSYFPILETLGEVLATLEDEVLDKPSKVVLRKVNRVRSDLVVLRRILWPQREAINDLIHEADELVTATVREYLRDSHDHCLQISEVIESYRELVGAVANTYLSVVSNKTNEVMRVLTIMASLFIPLTFMAGIYGMNFEEMPELKYSWGYPLVWLSMIVVAAGMLTYFYRRGWIGSSKEDE
ncbi:MAG: magnesium/cobalt transporter CorA [bacterium]|nr:magnesium/cobalt transporter CorA [bacterium]